MSNELTVFPLGEFGIIIEGLGQLERGELELDGYLNLSEKLLNLDSGFTEISQNLIPWKIGDTLNYGEALFGEKWSQAVDPAKHNLKTCGNRMRVAKAIPKSRRRENELSFSHHAEVYKLDPSDQVKYLQIAIDDDMSVSALRELITGSFPTERRLAVAKRKELGHPNIEIKVETDEDAIKSAEYLVQWIKVEERRKPPSEWPLERVLKFKEIIKEIKQAGKRLGLP